MKLPLVNMTDVDSALHNARILMNAYLRSRINLVPDQTIRIALSKRAPEFKYEGVDGKNRGVKNLVLTFANDEYIVQYNGNVNTSAILTSLSANELYTLCSIVESFWKHIKKEDKTDIEDVECEIVK
jgi:hypothetical protein